MGGSGGSIGSGWNPGEIARQVREAEKLVHGEKFQTELAGFLSQLLARFNDRDVDLVRKRLGEIVGCLEGVLADRVDQIFGGSVAKHTYVDGLSDIDCLLIVDGKVLANSQPEAVLAELSATLRKRMPNMAEVNAGSMAVTVRYPDGMEIQLLPAAREGERLKIPSSRAAGEWSTVDPAKFNAGLTKYNAACDGKLVPTIKLAKAIIAQLPEAQQLSGYHIESLAIDAFRSYSGAKTTAAMLPHFFECAKERVRQPMTDSTGQSVHVDEYMGTKDSVARANTSHILGRISKRIANATASGSLAQWKEIFGDGE